MAGKTVKINNRVLVRGIRVDEGDEVCDEQTILIPQTMYETQKPVAPSAHLCHTEPSTSRQNSADSGISKEQTPERYIKREHISTPDKNVSWSPTTIPTSPSSIFTMDFDMLFENPDDMSLRINHAKLKFGTSVDEGVYAMYSFDSDNSRVSDGEGGNSRVSDVGFDDVKISTDVSPGIVTRPKLQARLSRKDSIMEQTMSQMLIKNWESSQGYMGFRSKVAREFNHMYCSYCRCDQLVFVFLYVVFGMMYICTGMLGLTECNSEQMTNIFLIVDGLFSCFVFPVTIMEWPKRIGGCVKEDEKIDGRSTFFIILFLRISAAVSGSVIMFTRIDLFQRDDAMCWTVFTVLKIGVLLEWAFMVFALLLPFLLFCCCYIVAKRL